VFINGESFRAAGRDARLMRRLADRSRVCAATDVDALSDDARELLDDWLDAGWLQRSACRMTNEEEPRMNDRPPDHVTRRVPGCAATGLRRSGDRRLPRALAVRSDFADWPLGERDVIERLTEWAASSRR
jgi:hypothetical protein